MHKCEWKSKDSDESPQQLHWMWMEQEYYLLFSWRWAQVSHLALYTGKKASQPVIQSITNYLKSNPLLHTGVLKNHVNHDNTCIQELICLYCTGRQWRAITTGIEFTLFWIECVQTCQSRSWAFQNQLHPLWTLHQEQSYSKLTINVCFKQQSYYWMCHTFEYFCLLTVGMLRTLWHPREFTSLLPKQNQHFPSDTDKWSSTTARDTKVVLSVSIIVSYFL